MKKHEVLAASKCSFCKKDYSEVRKMIAGPENHICNECVDLFTKLFANKNETKPAITCTFCLSEKQELMVSREARICKSCIELCKDMMGNKFETNIEKQ